MHDNDADPGQHHRHNIAMWVLLAIVMYFLVTEHWAHIVPFLPYALLLACPLMHLFMHGGHGGHGGHRRGHGDHEADQRRDEKEEH